jgi:hypothetical protein
MILTITWFEVLRCCLSCGPDRQLDVFSSSLLCSQARTLPATKESQCFSFACLLPQAAEALKLASGPYKAARDAYVAGEAHFECPPPCPPTPFYFPVIKRFLRGSPPVFRYRSRDLMV